MDEFPVGIDVAQDTFEAELVLKQSRKRRGFRNTTEGFAEFLKWCRSFKANQLRVCMESTGRCQYRLAMYLYAVGQDVRLAQGKRIRRFAEALGLLCKTDKADAHAIAEYALHHPDKLRRWEPPSEARRVLADVRCQIAALQKTKQAFENRAGSGIEDEEVLASFERVLAVVEAELEEANARAAATIDADPQLREDKRILMTQIGVKEVVSTVLLTRIDFRSFTNGRQAGRYVGLTPKREQSGTSIQRAGRISKEGPSDVRAALYNAARTAIQHDPAMRAYAERLRASGKGSMQVKTAVMRKILVRSWALVTRGTEYDPNYRHPLAIS